MLKTITSGLRGLNRVCERKRFIFLSPRLQCTTAPEVTTMKMTENLNMGNEHETNYDLAELRAKYPEFVPNPDLKVRNWLREKLERQDMLTRRKNINIPEFYVGSILAVTTSDVHSPGKTTRFLGICIYRFTCGLRSKFILRNVIEGEAVEVIYPLYSPIIQKIEVIKLEKRLDSELFYLRDAPLKYSTFPQNMEQCFIDERAEVPVNTMMVELNPRPWLLRYERMNLKGVILPELSEKIMKKAEKHKKPWEKYDLMQTYRSTIPEEEQDEIFSSILNTVKELETKKKLLNKEKEIMRMKKEKIF